MLQQIQNLNLQEAIVKVLLELSVLLEHPTMEYLLYNMDLMEPLEVMCLHQAQQLEIKEALEVDQWDNLDKVVKVGKADKEDLVAQMAKVDLVVDLLDKVDKVDQDKVEVETEDLEMGDLELEQEDLVAILEDQVADQMADQVEDQVEDQVDKEVMMMILIVVYHQYSHLNSIVTLITQETFLLHKDLLKFHHSITKSQPLQEVHRLRFLIKHHYRAAQAFAKAAVPKMERHADRQLKPIIYVSMEA
jgi:hypothetical protein